jgi:Flp pilus assembly protein TadB
MIFMPSIWTLIAGVSMVAILAAFQWWLSGHARRFARMHRSTARSFEPRPSGMVARRRPRPPSTSNLARKLPSKPSTATTRPTLTRRPHGPKA